MTNQQITKLLRQIAAAYIVKNENRFKIIAYERAADSIENSPIEVKDIWLEGKLSTLPGIGASIASHLDELFKTGKVRYFDKVKQSLPSGMFTLLDVPGFGPKTAYRLASEFKLHDAKRAVDMLLKAARSGKIAVLDGFGVKSQADIIESLIEYRKGYSKVVRMPLPYAYNTALQVIEYLQKCPDSVIVMPLGSLRRNVSTIGDIDLAVATKKPNKVVDWFSKYPKIIKNVEKGPTGATILVSGNKQIDLRVQSPEKFGAMIQYFTGGKEHNIKLREMAMKKGFSLSEHGIRPLRKVQSFNKKMKLYEFTDEVSFYKFLGLDWIPPELRENRGEIEASLQRKLPQLVTLKDILGDVHLHSNYDLNSSHDIGSSSIKDLVHMAVRYGYKYIGISDHNPSHTNQSNEDIIGIMMKRNSYIEQIKKSIISTRVHLFTMIESDILPNGKLALPNGAFPFVDGIIVSIHSNFRQTKREMTSRILSGLSHPKAKILAHPTGRLIGKRDGYEVDWDKLFHFCHLHNKALEINANPERLDLPDMLVRKAIKKGVKLVIGTDSHDKSQMELMRYGVAVARRGWATKNDILNCLPYNMFKAWLTDY